MKTIILIISLCFSTILWGEEITDFNSPLWNYGTGNGADATGAGTLGGVSFNMVFNLNGGTKLFTSNAKHTSNSTLGHGGPLGSLLLSGSGEGLSISFATPITVILGFSHVNVATDGWDFITPADEIASLHNEHIVYEVVSGSGSLDGIRQKGPTNANMNSISYFKWNNVTTINLQTVGSSGTTLAFSSMRDVPPNATLELTKTLSSENGSVAGYVEAGEILTYTITLSNFGGTDGSFTIDEKVPTGTTFVAAGNDFNTCVDGAAAGSICSLDIKVPSLGSTTKTFIVIANNPLTTTSIENFVIESGTTPPICSAADSSDSRCVSTAAVSTMPEITLQKTSQTLSDPVNGTTSPKAIPGALAEYTIVATNSGHVAADNNSIIITDAIPSNTALYVNDISGAGTGSIRFVDGTPSSGLSYTYTSLGSTTDGLSFSNNGGTTYTYVPSPDAGGVDTNVTNIRIATIGQFLASGGSGSPSFSLLFRVKVK